MHVVICAQKVDRTIRQPEIEKWIQARRLRAKSTTATLLFDVTNHIEHWWRERPRYVAELDGFVAVCTQ